MSKQSVLCEVKISKIIIDSPFNKFTFTGKEKLFPFFNPLLRAVNYKKLTFRQKILTCQHCKNKCNINAQIYWGSN